MTRVLIADDDIVVRDVVRRYLERDGLDVSIAHDGTEALRGIQVTAGTGEIVALGVSVTTTIDPSHKDMPTYKGDGEPLTTPAGAKAETKIAPATPADTVQGWNTVEIIVRGDGAEHIVNGKTVARLTDAKAQGAKDAMVLLDRGRIGLQAEGHEIFYRNVELCPLDAK